MRLAMLCIILFMTTVSMAQEALKIGSRAPNIIAVDQEGHAINLKEMAKNQLLVVTFYRGQWCPHCNRAMSYLQDSMALIKELGAQVLAITPEDSANIEKTKEQTAASFHIISDKGHKIMDDYKVTFRLKCFKHFIYKLGWININKNAHNKDRVLPVPAVYILDTKGIIRASYFNEDYSQRMHVKDILKALREINGSDREAIKN